MSQPLSEEQALEILRKIDKLNAKRQALGIVKEQIDQQLHSIMCDTIRLQEKLKPEDEAISLQ